MDFAIRILAWRKSTGLTQKKFGEICGLSQGAVSNWEQGRNPPTLEMLNTIVTKALGTTMHRFWAHIPKARKPAKASARAQAAA